MHAVIGLAAGEAARGDWARMGARTESEARAFFLQSFRRRIGVGVVREFARHRLLRAPMVGASSDVLRAQAPRPQPAGARRSPFEFYVCLCFQAGTYALPRKQARGRRPEFGTRAL